jgi:predicted porin
VTLFGIVDVSVAQIQNKDSNGSSTTTQQMRTDGLNSSRLGFRGVEDLGGGLKAGFWLEAALAADTGTVNTTKFFSRRATVSLLGGFGEVRLGRDYTPTFWNLTVFDPFGTNGVGSLLNMNSTLGSGASTAVRADNAVGYLLPSGIGGLYGQFQLAAGEGGFNNTQPGNKYAGGRIGFAAGPMDIAGAYGETEVPGGDKLKIATVGGAFSFGPAKLTGQYQQSKFNERKQQLWQVGTVIALGQGEIHAAYSDSDMSGGAAGTTWTDGSDSQLLAIGYVYNVSKRTALYGTAARINNDGSAAIVLGSPGSAQGGKSTGVEAGVRHSF